MPVTVTNESGSPFRIVTGNRPVQTIPSGGTTVLSDTEFESIPFGKRGTGQINPSLGGGGGATVTPEYATETDKVGDVTYVGEALPNTLLSATSWRVKRVTNTDGDFSVQWADGDAFFNNVWDDHLTLVYV